MWINVFRVGGIILHLTGVFSIMQKKPIVKKHRFQTVIVPYMENTDSDILGLGITSSLMWISNRGHVFRVGVHITSDWRVFECVDAK